MFGGLVSSSSVVVADDLIYYDIANNLITWVHGDAFTHSLRTPATIAPTAGVEASSHAALL